MQKLHVNMEAQHLQEKLAVTPHVILLPLPLQGPTNCFLKLTELLSSSSLDDGRLFITFINAEFIQRRLSDLPDRFPDVRFCVLSDGIVGDQPRPAAQVPDMVKNYEGEFISKLLEFVNSSVRATCLIADGIFTLAGRTAMGMGIPVVYFSTLSPNCIWASCGLVPKLLEAGEVPFKSGDNLDEPVVNIPGSNITLRRRDLPGFCRMQDMTNPYVQLIIKECQELPIAQGHILNSFDQLEGSPLLAELRSLCPNLYTIGPIHLHLKTRQLRLATESRATTCNSFWQQDTSCIQWLDAQPSKSVLYVSFGSMVELTIEQLMEFWYGLVESGVRFLWVKRPDSVAIDHNCDKGQLNVPAEVLDGTKQRGCVVNWAPQEEVLAHRAVGGFLTHSGWNSTLESIVEGVPMLCWPCGIDQMVISRFIEEVWKIGIDMKDRCDRVVIANMVRDLMERRRDEFLENAKVLSKLAAQAVNEGGPSWCGLDRLIDDIRLMRLEIPKFAS